MPHPDDEQFDQAYIEARLPGLTPPTPRQADAIVSFYYRRRASYINSGLDPVAAARRALRDVSQMEGPA